MTTAQQVSHASLPAIHDLIAADARELSAKLQAHRLKLFPPAARKSLRRFSSGEAAKLIGINDGYFRQLSLEGKGPRQRQHPVGDAPTRSKTSKACVPFSRSRERAGAVIFRIALAANTCRCSRWSISRAVPARQQPPPIWRNIWP